MSREPLGAAPAERQVVLIDPDHPHAGEAIEVRPQRFADRRCTLICEEPDYHPPPDADHE